MRAQRISQGKFAGVLTVRSKLDYEERNRFTLVLKAEDSAVDPEPRLSSTATITLEVVDVQDQPPVFLNTPYHAVIEENSLPGIQALSVKVRDGDTGQPRNLLLEIVDDPFNYFRIESFQMESGIGAAKIVTTESPIDRENEVILALGGVYVFKLKVSKSMNSRFIYPNLTFSLGNRNFRRSAHQRYHISRSDCDCEGHQRPTACF